jgi:endoglucanase
MVQMLYERGEKMRAKSLFLVNQFPLAAALLGCAMSAAGQSGKPPQVNQVGFLPQAAKWASIAVDETLKTDAFEVVNTATGETALQGKLLPAQDWSPGGQRIQLAEFSSLKTPGSYRIRVAGLPESAVFAIGEGAYDAVSQGVMKAYYFARAGMALEAKYAGAYARKAGHPDDKVLVHASAADSKRPSGTRISSPKGWYDSGNYNKSMVSSSIAAGMLLAAYEHFPGVSQALQLQIPEQGSGLPDLLSELAWSLDWMLSMQDPEDGGVYHQLSNLEYGGDEMPDASTEPRYVLQKTTAATLGLAASLAMASRVYAKYEEQRPGYSKQLLDAAQRAFAWAESHPQAIYLRRDDVKTGAYVDDKMSDEFAWAATELFLSTKNPSYRSKLQLEQVNINQPSWRDVSGMVWMSLAQHIDQLSAEDAALVRQTLQSRAQQDMGAWKASAYRLVLPEGVFKGGGTGMVLSEAMLMVAAYRLLPQERTALDVAQSAMDYALGRNPLGMSMVTGFGTHSPLHPHHRPSLADGVEAPVPGFVVGGPNIGQQDKNACPAYPQSPAALAYLDNGCSYSTNQVAIHGNAPMVYLLTALKTLTASSQ